MPLFKREELSHWREIFTPSGLPRYTYVEHDDKIKTIINHLNFPTRYLLAVRGISGIGKSVLLQHILSRQRNYVRHNETDFHLKHEWHRFNPHPNVWQNGDDIFNQFRRELDVHQRQVRSEKSILFGRNELSGGFTHEETWIDEPNYRDLINRLRNRVIVIEDFHSISRESQRKALEFIKGLYDQAGYETQPVPFRFVLLYIPSKLNEDPASVDLFRGRVETIDFDLWDVEELTNITRYSFNNQEYKVINAANLAENAFGLPSLMQELCLTYCTMYESGTEPPATITIHETSVKKVLQEVANDIWDEMGGQSGLYDLITLADDAGEGYDRDPIESKIDGRKGDIYQMIWYVISLIPTASTPSARMPRLPINESISFSISDLRTRLQLATDASSEQLDNIERYVEKIAGFYEDDFHTRRRAGDPGLDLLFEYKPGKRFEESQLIIHNPRLLFILAHSEHHRARFQ